ncbi:energy transducer TonB [Geofilum rubicundum]|uniref:Ferric siderophore transport system, periplasmic binding protein TonB n=1 Tax=Geofilum rubicundum JCM 15548 TaxID=1236989 RepID=A0A0E9LXM7_9BACT|nr:energy transducer TonB [Geofilum rubicundum]GAO30053.1 ferric siderophore transport system, periplasmic binding protein TonB [Geofilum rubicundum JCM 15548]
MEVKKSPKADLENKKTVFMQIGLVVVLSLVLIAFEWTSTDVNIDQSLMEEDIEVEEEIIPITRQEEVKPPPPPPPPAVADILNIVEDDVELDDELEIMDTEMNQDDMVDFSNMVMEEETRDAGEIFMIVEEMPEFPGGQEALQKYLASSVRYPVIAQENGIQGRVYVQFVIDQTGAVTNATILRGVDPSLDREALRVVQAMPKWKPGKQRNRAVRVSYTVPINFVLQ